MSLEVCHSCNGAIKVVDGPGRFKMYRGVNCEFPAELGIRTCVSCGAEWMHHDEIKIMSDSFEMQRLATLLLKRTK